MTNHKKFRTFDDYLVESLQDPEEAQAFLNAALEDFQEDNDLKAFLLALEILIKSKSTVSKFAQQSEINRTHIYKILNNEVQPQFNTINNILKNLGFQLSVKVIPLDH